MGVGVNFAIPKENKFGDPPPPFLLFFLKGKLIVYEIKQNLKILNVRFLVHNLFLKSYSYFGGITKIYTIQYLVTAWENK